jgi:hypothetical protein
VESRFQARCRSTRPAGNLAEGFVHGIGLVLEAVRQIRGTSANQVPGADISLLLGGPVAPLFSATVLGSAATL